MGISLTEFESRARVTAPTDLRELQQAMADLAATQVKAEKRLLTLLDGWSGVGKTLALKAIVAPLDPCLFRAHSALDPAIADDRRHWLAAYWERLPRTGEATFFRHSWYRALVERRVGGEIEERRWSRALDEINELEAQQADHDTVLVKLFFHIDPATQAARMPDDFGAREAALRDRYVAAWNAVFERTDTRWAPWRLVDGRDGQAAAGVALEQVIGVLSAALAGTARTAGQAKPARLTLARRR